MTSKLQMEKNSRTWYLRNKGIVKKRTIQRRKEIKVWLNDYKSKLTCISCPENHISCTDFHHKDPSKKDMGISKVADMGWGIKRILTELKKCVLICSNCHRKLHWRLRNKLPVENFL
jgi:transcription elongation factor Elf1